MDWDTGINVSQADTDSRDSLFVPDNAKQKKYSSFLSFCLFGLRNYCFSSEHQLRIFHTFSHALKGQAFSILRLYWRQHLEYIFWNEWRKMSLRFLWDEKSPLTYHWCHQVHVGKLELSKQTPVFINSLVSINTDCCNLYFGRIRWNKMLNCWI